ncbi:MAG: GNAT family N-acetyltransferase [Bacillota bacterium]
MNLQIKALSPSTWEDFASLAQRHHGVWGGCWCVWFHQSDMVKRGDAAFNKELKRTLVMNGRAHAALVYDGDTAVAWCQFGTPEELPHIYHKKEVETDGYQRPDYRITCLFVDKEYRGKGVAKAAVLGALDLIGKAGGGIVESYPQDMKGTKTSGSFLYNGTLSLFRECGFELAGAKGKNHTIMRKSVAADSLPPKGSVKS